MDPIRPIMLLMDQRTLDYYSKNAGELTQRYESASSQLANRFRSCFSPGGRVLDVGCGSGRDLAELHRQGFDVFGIEGTPAMAEIAVDLHPELRERISVGLLPEFDPPDGGEFDAVLCSAVLMHIGASDLFNAALSIKRCLKLNGRLLLTVPSERGDLVVEERDAGGRLFKNYAAGFLQLLFERLGFRLIDQWSNDDALNRVGIRWVNLLFHLGSVANTRPIDQIEAVLNYDRKTATYKYALFRALSEIATQSTNAVIWRGSSTAELPVALVAENWIQYYWPIVSSEQFIPQMNGEEIASPKQIKFRASLRALTDAHSNSGAYSGFRLQRNRNELSLEGRRLLAKATKDVTSAIVNGPVAFAGVGSERGAIFSYDRARKAILIPADLWLELSHLGYWISQAVILQWAEKTTTLGPNLDVAETLKLLIAKEDVRSTEEARRFFSKYEDLECVWTGAAIRKKFDVDHVIPFDLWRNNDVWNLLPASPQANAKKSNKLPSLALLRSRKHQICRYWTALRAHNRPQFDKEAQTLITLEDENWADLLFGELCAAIEVTALQRGIVRWNG
jgi:SAM-dependent methyltransferase